jgi:hypothetical protein
MLQLLYSGDKAPGTHYTGGWVGPRASNHAVEKRKISYSCWKLNPDSNTIQPVTILVQLNLKTIALE